MVCLQRPDVHSLCNKAAFFCYRLDGHKDIRNIVVCFFYVGSMGTKSYVTKRWRFFVTGSMDTKIVRNKVAVTKWRAFFFRASEVRASVLS